MKMFIHVIVAGLLAMPLAAAATEEPVIQSVQSPVWVERAGRQLPARPGSVVREGDLIRTGLGGRAQIDLPEGSRVKLGQQAEFRPNRMVERTDAEGGFFDAALDVLKGAFRFTTGLAGKERRRNVNIRVGVVTAGIRGTDIWGRSGDDGDFVVLLEGKIEMSTSGMAPQLVTEPLDGRIVPKGQDMMQPMQNVTMEVVQTLALETELDPERGALTADGAFQLVLMSVRRPAGAEALQSRLENAGYPAYVEAVPLNGTMWHRVVIDNVADVENGHRLGRMLVEEFGAPGFWIRPLQ